jgi:cation diffusion facilitator family transporter
LLNVSHQAILPLVSEHEHVIDGHDHDHRRGHDHGCGRWARVRHALTPHSHDANEAIQNAEQASSHGIRAAWIGLAGMMATAAAQVVIVAISGSVALLADTVHNLGHAATTIPLIIAFRIGRRPATDRYSYGFRRAEDLVGLFIGLIILLSAGLIIWESIDALVTPRELSNLGWVFAAGVVGFLGNEIVAVYRIRAGRRIGSAALIAEGQHARTDGLTSIAVVVGVVGVWLGFERADAVVGLLIGLVILGILASSMRTVGRRLMDGVDAGVIATMRATVAATPGVAGVDSIRARWTGHRVEGDAAIRVAGDLSVRQAHQVAEDVEHALLHATPSLERVVIHVHPVTDDDEEAALHRLTGHHTDAVARLPADSRTGP